MTSTWRLAKPARIAAALAVSQAQDSGGWFVAGASSDVGSKESVARTIAGREVVFWRNSEGGLVAGPALCPHLGALMDKCPVLEGSMYCRWHGIAFTQQGDATWSPYRAYDDGALIWVRLPTEGEIPTEKPVLPARPPLADSVTAVIAHPGVCEPQDVIANRLDPWHGSWFHPYAFSHLVVDDEARTRRADTLALARTADPIPITEAVMSAWARLVADARAAGVSRLVRLTDALIAATAVVHGLPVVTQDDDFERIAAVHPALRVVWV